MAELALYDLVKEVSFATGTGNLAIASVVSGFRAFAGVVPDGTPFPYTIVHATLDEWEIGVGEIQAGALVRRPLDSSNGGAAVNFSAGTKEISVSINSAVVRARSRWGTGEDGALMISGSTVVTLTRDGHYTTIAWNAFATGGIVTNGFVLHCEHLNLTNCPTGGIRNDANGKTGAPWGSVGGGINGGDTAAATDPEHFGFAVRPPAVLGGPAQAGFGSSVFPLPARIGPLPEDVTLAGIPAGAGGGGHFSFGNGYGGGGGGVVEIRARRITRTSGTATAAIRANGGVGEYHGGGGGRVRVIYELLLGEEKAGALQANGGAGGASAGRFGGHGGAIELINMRTGATSFTMGTAGADNGVAGTCSANL